MGRVIFQSVIGEGHVPQSFDRYDPDCTSGDLRMHEQSSQPTEYGPSSSEQFRQ